jgi:hypothetical protein
MNEPTSQDAVASSLAVARRVISTHKGNGLNDAITVETLDTPGSGGANHRYRLVLKRPSAADPLDVPPERELLIEFQNGPILEAGYNGFTNEALLAVLIDRMESFQKGPYRCDENAGALMRLQEASMWLAKRTLNRTQRGVEGTHQA